MAIIREDISTPARLYVQTSYGEPAVKFLKACGAHWDADAKCWWVGKAKRDRVYGALVASDKKQDEDHEQGKPPEKEDPHDIRLVGKARYKDRIYYVRAISKDGARARLVTLDQAIDFWVPIAKAGDGVEVAVMEKTYQPRKVWDGRRNSGQTVTKHTTLGSIKDFIDKQNSDRAAGKPACAACGKAGELVADLEDGLLKHPRCCDIEP